eukprot:gene868-22721_t
MVDNCWWDAAQRRSPLCMYLEDKIDAFGSIRHAVVGQDMLDCGLPPDAVYRCIAFWSKAKIHIITAMGITAGYSQDFAGIQGDLFVQLVFLKYAAPTWEAAETLGMGYPLHITGRGVIRVPMSLFSDDTTMLENEEQRLQTLVTAGGMSTRTRLLGSEPSKGHFLGVKWRTTTHADGSKTVGPRSIPYTIWDNGQPVRSHTLREHVVLLGLEACPYVGHSHALSKLKKAITLACRAFVRRAPNFAYALLASSEAFSVGTSTVLSGSRSGSTGWSCSLASIHCAMRAEV